MPKFVFITGGVMSGLGKGLVTCSIGKILQVRGFTVNVVKIDPYLNVDAGTMNPYIHGEVYVLDDGYEADMDLGAYERFLGLTLNRWNNITTGQVYQTVIERERRGEYLGKCVQIIPHVTDEIKRRIRLVADQTNPDVLIVECGGTVGDIESLPFLEAFRQMRLEEEPEDTMLVHVTLVPMLKSVGELKTKPTQHSVMELRRIGLQPDAIVVRCEQGMVTGEPRRKIALYSNVAEEAVFTSYDVECIYELPMVLDEQGLGKYVCRRLKLEERTPDWSEWKKIVDSFKNVKHDVRIAMCGKYAKLADCYVSVNEALRHSGAALGARVHIDWIETEEFEDDPSAVEKLANYDGVLVPGGFGVRGTEGKIRAIEYARTHGIPFLGICFGFQLAVVEYARNVVGLKEAHSTECNPDTPHPVIDLLPEQRGIDRLGGTMRLGLHPIDLQHGSLVESLYGSDRIYERHRHRYEVNPEYIETLQRSGLKFTGWSPDRRRMEVLEISSRSFFLATQFHPEFKSRPGNPSPVYYGFVRASLERALSGGA